MKTRKLETWLLLEQTGELSTGRLRRLERELAVSDAARRLRTELDVLSSSILKPDVEPLPWAVARIAASLSEERNPLLSLSGIAKPVLALAAGLVLVLGIWNFHDEQASSASIAFIAASEVDVWNVPFEEDLSRLENLIVAISGDPLDIMEM